MIIIELNRGRRPGEAGFAARIRADGCEISIDGPEVGLIDHGQAVLSLRDGRTITCDDDPEEWVRGLAASFRTPYLSARVVEDTDPYPMSRSARLGLASRPSGRARELSLPTLRPRGTRDPGTRRDVD